MKFFITLMAIIGLTAAVPAVNSEPRSAKGGRAPGTGNGCDPPAPGIVSSLLRLMLVDYYQLET